MKTFIVLNFFILISVFTLFAENRPQTITLAYEDQEAFPWVLTDTGGLDIELLKILERNMKIKIQYERYPWKRCLDTLKRNQIDGIFASSFKADRAEMGAYPYDVNKKDDGTKRIHTSEYSIYRLKGSKVDWDGSKFINVNGVVGTQSGFSMVDTLKKMGIKVDDGSKGVAENLKKLLMGRVEAVVVQTARGDHTLTKNPDLSAKIEKIEESFEKKPYYLMLSFEFVKKYPEFSKELWNEIEKTRESLEFKKKIQEFYDGIKE